MSLHQSRSSARSQQAQTAAALVRASALFRDAGTSGWLRHLAAGVLMALFVVTVLVALAVGVTAYGTTFDVGQSTDQGRLAGPLLYNVLMGNDYADAVSTVEGPEGPALVLTRQTPSGVYDTRLYLYQGQLVQDYVLGGAPVDPALAEPLFETQTFSFDQDGSLLRVTTDQGTVEAALRSTTTGGR